MIALPAGGHSFHTALLALTGTHLEVVAGPLEAATCGDRTEDPVTTVTLSRYQTKCRGHYNQEVDTIPAYFAQFSAEYNCTGIRSLGRGVESGARR